MEDISCKQHKKRTETYGAPSWWGCIIMVALLIAAIVWDACEALPRIPVDESYLGLVFAALCTVAVLGTAMQSVIVGAFQHKILGFTVRELLRLFPEQLDLMRTVFFAFAAIVLAMVFLAAQFYTAMTALTVCVVLLIGKSSLKVWLLLSDPDEETLAEYLLTASRIPPETCYAKWFPEVRQALADGDEQKLSKYLERIKIVAQASREDDANVLQAQAGSIFPAACERLGFVDAFKKILLLNDWGFKGLDYRAAAIDYIDQIRFCPDNALFTYRIASTVDDIFERMELDDGEKIYYAYHYYSAVEKNTVINYAVRRDTIGDIFEKLCLLFEGGTGVQREKTLLRVVRSILEKEDVSDRQMQWGLLMEKLYHHHYSRDRCYIGVIAQIFRALFFFCFFETDTLREEYRDGLKGLCMFSCTGKDIVSPSLSKLVLQKRSELIEWFAADLKVKHKGISVFDYYPENGDGKIVVWDVETCTCFAFWFYLLVGYRGGHFPYALSAKSEDAGELDSEVCRALVSNFEDERALTLHAREMIQKMRTLLGVDHSLAEALAERNFSYFNQALADLQKVKIEAMGANISDDIEELNAAFAKQLKDMEGVQYSQDVSMDGARKITVEPHISPSAMYSAESRAFYLRDAVQWFLNAVIKEELRPEKLWFGKESVCRLYELLSRDAYTYTNYRYTDDLSFHQDVRESEGFKALKALLEKLDVISDSDIRQRVFLRRPIRFNAQVVEYTLREPTDAQCEDYIDGYKIADGKYRIDGVLYNHTQAIGRAKMFKAVYYALAVATDIGKESGFRVELDRNAEYSDDGVPQEYSMT